MNSTIAKLADEFEKMEKTIASQKKMIETLMPMGYVDTDTVKLWSYRPYFRGKGGTYRLRLCGRWYPVPREKLQEAVYHLPESGVQVP